jgi:hypothetical protein
VTVLYRSGIGVRLTTLSRGSTAGRTKMMGRR